MQYEHEHECSVVSDSLQPLGLHSPWNSPGQNTGVGSLSLLQGIFPTQESIPGLPLCRQIRYQLSHKGSPWSCSILQQELLQKLTSYLKYLCKKQRNKNSLKNMKNEEQRSPGVRNGNPLLYFCLGNPMDIGTGGL